ncbi:MFS transporter [Geomonas nitrogeniifigens]|uniref:MFS transporter n=1 Tax=Geomonas diazotrophica TaxID=2843197 RepID=A0ABX8JJQ4_9BACT|nr:MFS transporter [Geomonas nitrogeniifigens]QWV98618.1 MFS transporter [Geomonas nitrogeniifigens]QXE87794.1 MFS transporter [Geomonas nitrogeniifigens]
MRGRKLLGTLFLVNFAVTLGFGIADAFFSTYLFSLGARGLMLGLPLVCYSLSKIACGPALGAWSDRVGYRKAVLLSLALYLLVSVGYLLNLSVAALTVLRLLQGVSCALFRPVLLSLVGSCAGEEERGTVLATFDISFYGALCLGPLAGGILKDCGGFAGVFAAVALLCVIALFAALRGIPGGGRFAGNAPRHARTGAPQLWRSGAPGSYRALLAFIFGRAFGISLTGAFLPILLTGKLGLTGVRSGLVLASGTVAMTLLLRPMGILSDRAPRRLLVLAGGSAVSLLYFLIPAAPGFYQMLLLTLAIGVCSVVSQPASSALLVEEGARHGMAVTVGTFNAALNLGFAAGPLLGALLQGAFGLVAVFHAAGTIGLGAVALFALHTSQGEPEVALAASPKTLAVASATASSSCESVPPYSHAA